MAITTNEVRLGYVHLDRPYAPNQSQEAKYSVQVMVPKTDVATKAMIDAAIQEATQYGIQNKWNGVAPPVIPTPIHDGDGVKDNGEPYGPECKGHWIFSASAKADRKPSVVDMQLQEIINPSEIYSGMYGRVNINFYPYIFSGKKGIGVGLNHVQKTRDGESLGGGHVSVEAAFGAPAAPAQGVGVTINPITGQPM